MEIEWDKDNPVSNSAVRPSPVTAKCSGNRTSESAYDADGNQTLVKTSTGIWRVSYNGENRPVRWESGDTVITMSFDRMGRRVAKDNRRFVYDGYLQVADNVGNAYVWDPTEPAATRPLAWVSGGTVAYYTHDGNKNVSEVVAADGTLAAHYGYAPFGAVTVRTGELASANPFRFSGEYADDALGLVYYNYRHYDPMTGRWLRRDPIGDDRQNEEYVWCENKACNQKGVDLLGLTNEPGAFGWHGYGSEQTQCCKGKPYFPSSSCCKNGEILSKKAVSTGVSYFCMHSRWWYQSIIIIRPYSSRQFMLTHCWLNVNGNRFGAYPNGGPFKGPQSDGKTIRNDEDHKDDEDKWYTSRTDVHLSPCEYDLDAFKSCMSEKRNAAWNWRVWSNCGDFVEAAISDCKGRARYD